MLRRPCRALSALLLLCCLAAASASAQTSRADSLPSETPASFTPATDGYDYQRREVMIPMRDGVKLRTVILVPNGAHRAGMLLTLTPYGADGMGHRADSPHLGATLRGYDNPADLVVEDGYIRVIQDIRGKHGSEGDFVMNRPLRGPLNPTAVDDSTDIYDTVDWLSRHVPESNGKVGIIGISYDGFEALMALVHPHPALKVAVPVNPMVDGWMGDDWFHHGAFREQMLPYIYEQDSSRESRHGWWSGQRDDYDLYLDTGSAGALARSRGMESLGFWQKILAHPAYDAFWQQQAVDKLLAAQPLQVPTMLVHSLWDQEDSYGAMAVYRALAAKEANRDKLHLVLGPWCHAQQWGNASSLGAIDMGSDTATHFRQAILRPFLAQYLKDDAPKAKLAPVYAFVTGANSWQPLDAWPAGCRGGCAPHLKPLYLHAGGRLDFVAPTAGEAAYDEYVSDPAKPTPYRVRPIQPWQHGVPDQNDTWPVWLADDQREAASRPDVLTYVSAPLTEPLRIAGEPQVHLDASTSGTDSDWVVKLIDVYPPEDELKPSMGGYEFAVSMDIFRGRYRQGFDKPLPLAPNQPLPYSFPLLTASHVFLPGHRLMVQVQSSWFPLYDRNPQTFVPNIFLARPEDYHKATQRVYHSPKQASYVELPVVPTGS